MARQPLEPMTAADIPARLRRMRHESSLTAREFARRLGVYPSTVSHWERGRQPIDRRTILCYQSICRNARQSRRRRNRAAGSDPRPFPTVLDADPSAAL